MNVKNYRTIRKEKEQRQKINFRLSKKSIEIQFLLLSSNEKNITK